MSDVALAVSFMHALRGNMKRYGIVPHTLAPAKGGEPTKRNMVLEFQGVRYPLTDTNIAILTRPRRALGSAGVILPKGRKKISVTVPDGCTLAQCRLYCKVLDRPKFDDHLARRAAPVALWVLHSLEPLN